MNDFPPFTAIFRVFWRTFGTRGCSGGFKPLTSTVQSAAGP